MPKKKADNRVETEKKRLLTLIECLPDARRKTLERIVENVAWQAIKLEDIRKEIADESITIPYDNGGGQMGIRENPMFKGYESLWRSYMTGMSAILDGMSKQIQEDEIPEEANPKTMLALIRSKHGA